MRILHTADWHLGKIVNEFSMLELQEEYLNNLVEEVKRLDVDILIMAGDLYDRAVPPKEAVSLANTIFTKLTQQLGIKVLVIAGNHDSNERIEYGSELLSSGNLFIEGTTKNRIRRVEIENTHFYLIPYDDYLNIRKILDDETIRTPEDALQAQLQLLNDDWNPEAINILIYHGFLINTKVDELPEESDSERPLSIGAVEYIPAEMVDDFDYVALGHLHKAQKVKNEKIRYSGSPLKYSKSEAKHHKQNLLVDISKDSLEVTPVSVKTSKDLRIIRGKFAEIMREPSDDFIFFELEDSSYVLDAMNKLRRKYPYTMGLEYLEQKKHEKIEVHHSKENIQKTDLAQLFADFYKQNVGVPLNKVQEEAILKTFKKVHAKEDDQ